MDDVLPPDANRLPNFACCQWCKKLGPEVVKLKRCGGCNVVMYCSRECQTAAWPVHRNMCRSKGSAPEGSISIGHEKLGYSAPLTLASAIQEWATHHSWSLETIARAVVHCNGGVDFNLANPRGVIFQLSPGTAGDGDPAKTFVLSRVSIESGDRHLIFRQQWKNLQAVCKSTKAMIEAQLFLGRQDWPFVGVIPAAYVVKTTGVVSYHHYSLLRLTDADDASLEERSRAVLRDRVRLCTAILNYGCVFGNPLNPLQSRWNPDPGRLVRVKKAWVWKPRPQWDWKFWSKALSKAVQTETGLPFHDIFTMHEK